MSSSVGARLNADLLEEKYAQWSDDPCSVETTWAAFFEGFELGSTQPKRSQAASAATGKDFEFYARVTSLVYNYRALGHTQARINPLRDEPERNPRLGLAEHDLGESDLDREIGLPFFRGGKVMKLREMIAELEKKYSGLIGFEFAHIHNTEVRHWMRQRIEQRVLREADPPERKKKALGWLLEAEIFESFLGKRFLGEKRFSIEGGEGLMVLLNALLEKCPSAGVREIEMGMAHRGRLNVLANFLRKSLTTLLYEFTPNYVPDLVAGDGDVKYHLGYEKVRELDDGEVRLSLAANPSHLEAVNAVVEGKARARQRILGDDGVVSDRTPVLPILIHGDAAFAGQGSVAEVLNLSQLPGYRTGGTVHIIVNNQIGFTTMPADARSSAYATDVAKMIEAPILHVNGEEPMELHWAAQFALEFRQTFGRDVVIDMYCYRRQGHNETDLAAFTQPHIARQIEARLPLGQIYKQRLVEEGVMDKASAGKLEDGIWERFDSGLEQMKELQQAGDLTKFSGSTAEAQKPYSHEPIPTGVARSRIDHVGGVLTRVPDGFQLNPTLAKRFIPRRIHALESGGPFDWAFAESLAWGTLLMEGTPVRLSGQDSRRGTFSQRHSVFYDFETRERYIPLKHLSETQAQFCVYNSLLSEAAVLGFDYGYSLGASGMLIMWEAQFGDFSNGAQVIIDQFIASAESKWQTPSDIVLLLPHGYEGMGPEHSSARLERFLQLCADENMIVANLSTPAQYFHALRRQKLREFRKPLVLMTPKSLLTKPDAASVLDDFLPGTCFQEVLPDPVLHDDPGRVNRVIFCSGKVYYDLAAYRGENEIRHTALIRIEQLHPLQSEMIEATLSQYSNASKFVWCQEEPMNMGAWNFIAPRLGKLIRGRLRYAGRDEASSTASGSKAVHHGEQKALVEEAFEV